MESNELKIGNYTLYGKDTFVLNSVSKNKCTGHFLNEPNQFGVEVISKLKPIPLTKEWFLKLGFNFDYYYSIGNITIRTHSDDIKDYFYFVFDNTMIFIHSVHQLQNLYFALTGKELTCQKENQKESN